MDLEKLLKEDKRIVEYFEDFDTNLDYGTIGVTIPMYKNGYSEKCEILLMADNKYVIYGYCNSRDKLIFEKSNLNIEDIEKEIIRYYDNIDNFDITLIDIITILKISENLKV